jgi:hypothetical protein
MVMAGRIAHYNKNRLIYTLKNASSETGIIYIVITSITLTNVVMLLRKRYYEYEDSSLVGCYAMSTGKQLLTFQKTVTLSSSG